MLISTCSRLEKFHSESASHLVKKRPIFNTQVCPHLLKSNSCSQSQKTFHSVISYYVKYCEISGNLMAWSQKILLKTTKFCFMNLYQNNYLNFLDNFLKTKHNIFVFPPRTINAANLAAVGWFTRCLNGLRYQNCPYTPTPKYPPPLNM